ncbi:MAG: polysaccharide deacetylase family protein [Microcoleaceae cyanobacterium]
MFHTVHPLTFKQQLEFLKINGYQTLNLATFMAFLRGEIQLEVPSVLLTFDDGDRSWYRVAYPLLKQYGFNAVGFVVPHYIQEQPQGTESKGWLSWPELIELDRTGVIEIESHSQRHACIFVEPRLVDFFHPEWVDSLGMDPPWIEEGGNYTNQLRWGTPIYRHAPRLRGELRYVDDPELRNACTAWVSAQGGEAFFERSSWRRELSRYYQTARQQVESPESSARYETETQKRQQMLEDLVRSRAVLSEKLGRPIQHFCYPWGAGGVQAITLSQEAGYQSNFWVASNRNTNRVGDSPFQIPRLKDDYLFRLPGEGRQPLWKIFQTKLQRRALTTEIY